MPTPYSEIDNLFLSDISDDTFLNYTEDEKEDILDNLRIKAITRFKACQKDLSDRTETEATIDEDTQEEVAAIRQFNETLTDEEKLIISTIMRKFWLNDKIYNLELIQQRMSTKDWRLTSQAEHLKNLTILKNDLEKEISRMIVDYTVYAIEVGDTT